MSNTTVYDEFLPLEEIQRRADNACMYFEKLPLKDFESLITADNVVDCVAQIAADTVFLGGIGKASKFVKNLDAISKIKCRASKIADKFKKAIQLRSDQPVLVTAEGAQIKVTTEMMTSQSKNINKAEKATKTTMGSSKSTQKVANQVEKQVEKIASSITNLESIKPGQYAIEINHPVVNNIRTGSALKLDAHHAFSDIVDNYARYAKQFTIRGNDGIVRELYQIEGSLNGTSGIFEWIVDPRAEFGITHRLFIKNEKITGMPNVFRKS